MKNKIWIVICAVILVILAVLLIWKPFGSKAGQNEAAAEPVAQATQVPAAQQNDAQTVTAQPTDADHEQTAKEETDQEQESTGAVMIESEGDLEIVIPEDQESDGF